MSFDKQPELNTCCERRHLACEHDTSDSWRSTSQTEKGWIVEKNNSRVSSETVEMAYAVCSRTNN